MYEGREGKGAGGGGDCPSWAVLQLLRARPLSPAGPAPHPLQRSPLWRPFLPPVWGGVCREQQRGDLGVTRVCGQVVGGLGRCWGTPAASRLTWLPHPTLSSCVGAVMDPEVTGGWGGDCCSRSWQMWGLRGKLGCDSKTPSAS